MGEPAREIEKGFRQVWLPAAVAEDVARARARTNAKVVAIREAHGTTIDPDEDQWRKLTGASERDLTALTQDRMQELALYVWERNLLANRLVELPLAYLLADGVRLAAEDEEIQEWLDRFWWDPINNMDLKLVKKARELAIFGEQCYPAFVNEFTGHVRLGYLDPAFIETVVVDPDNGEQKIGVVTKRNAKGIKRRYKIIVNGAEEDLFTERTVRIRNTFQDGECFFFSVNDLSNGRRGRSDLLASIDWLDAYDQFMFGELERSAAMRAFIWDVVLKGATPQEVKDRARQIVAPKSNSVRVHNDAEEWSAVAPELRAMDSGEMAKLFRNHLLGGRTIPEHWYGGASDVNRATGESMGEPTFKDFSMRQRYLGYMLEEMGRYAIRKKWMANGRGGFAGEPDLFDDLFDFAAVWPEMVARDTTKYAAALAQVTTGLAVAMDRHLLSKETAVRILQSIAERLGVEFDAAEELEKAAAEKAEAQEEDVFRTPPLTPALSPEGGEGDQNTDEDET